MPLMFAPDDLDAQAALRDAFDPDGAGQPAARCCRARPRCGDLQPSPRRVAEGAWISTAFAEEVGADGSGDDRRAGRTQWAAPVADAGVRAVRAPAGIDWIAAGRDDGAVRRRHDGRRARRRARRARPVRRLPAGRRRSAARWPSAAAGIRRLGYGPVRDTRAAGALRHRAEGRS